jgi:hypothetical protein
MRVYSFLLALVVGLTARAQKAKIDFARFEDSKERTGITEAFQLHFKKVFDVLPTVSPDLLYIKEDYAFLIAKVRDQAGGEIDFAKFNFEKPQRPILYKGQETRALFKKTAGAWKVIAFLVSPDDFSWACWWADYNAPKEIFDYTDYCR